MLKKIVSASLALFLSVFFLLAPLGVWADGDIPDPPEPTEAPTNPFHNHDEMIAQLDDYLHASQITEWSAIVNGAASVPGMLAYLGALAAISSALGAGVEYIDTTQVESVTGYYTIDGVTRIASIVKPAATNPVTLISAPDFSISIFCWTAEYLDDPVILTASSYVYSNKFYTTFTYKRELNRPRCNFDVRATGIFSDESYSVYSGSGATAWSYGFTIRADLNGSPIDLSDGSRASLKTYIGKSGDIKSILGGARPAQLPPFNGSSTVPASIDYIQNTLNPYFASAYPELAPYLFDYQEPTEPPYDPEDPTTEPTDLLGFLSAILKLLAKIVNTLIQSIGNVLSAILDLLQSLFVPDPEPLQETIAALQDKFAFVDAIKDFASDFAAAAGSAQSDDPPAAIMIDFNAPDTKWFSGLSGSVIVLDLSWFVPYRSAVHVIFSALLWICYLWRLFHVLPGVFSGSVGLIGSVSRSSASSRPKEDD